MNWKLIFQLSLLGLIMALGTISLIPEKFEFIFWIVIWFLVAFVIAKAGTGKYFMHGFWVSAFNSVYITIAHTIFYTPYRAHHLSIQQMIPKDANVVAYMVLIGIVSAVVFGLLQGLFAFVASKFVKPNIG